MNIKTRLQVSIILSLLLTLMVGALIFLSVQWMNKVSTKETIAAEIVKSMAELKIVTHEYLLYPSDRPLVQWRSKYNTLKEYLAEGYFRNLNEKIVIDKILKNLERFKTVFFDLVINARKGQARGKQERSVSRAWQNMLKGELLESSQLVVSLTFQLQRTVQAELVITQQRATLLIVFFLVAMTALMGGVSIWVKKSIAKPIAKLEEGTQIIGSGDLSYRVGTTAKDEIGQLSRAFDKMTEDLKKTTTSIVELNREIDERKKAEDALKASQDYTRNIIDSSLDMIIAVDMNRCIVEFNKAAERTFGYRREDIAGTMVDILYADPNEGLEVHKTAVDKGQCIREILNRHKNGEVFPSFLSASTLLDTHGNVQGVMGVSRDITEQKQAQDKLTASLKEKEVLLKEVHHRVKNNMQVISSMLSLQSQHITDKASRAMFEESQNRVRSMALIHEKLYTSEDLAHIDIAEYIHSLTHQLITTYRTIASRVNMDITVTDIFLAITTAIPCGLIINELVTNALKHAFPHQQKGTITVSMTPSTNDSLILTVSDTGIGFPEEIDFRNTTTLGMQLVTSLVEQLDGTITLDRSEGTRIRIEFRKQE